MKFAIILAAIMATSAFAVSPASSKVMMCSGEHLSKMTTMVGAMPDGPHKSEMYKHLEMVNIAMAKDGMRGCDMMMKKMMRGSKMKMMKSGM
ncbi:hypothetical protein [Tardiphaga sp. vice278]|uniref:hypothetical protein n=1 Tax=Tardiphaga sp. vice278 TaxID=2592815 RepID=UPI001161E9CA|nr:hypothetical protein [Tardiphaga sp. vice278]QDM18840.1 hypothetical protein FNL53_24970 [Tardiphaga sp. vice278]